MMATIVAPVWLRTCASPSVQPVNGLPSGNVIQVNSSSRRACSRACTAFVFAMQLVDRRIEILAYGICVALHFGRRQIEMEQRLAGKFQPSLELRLHDLIDADVVQPLQLLDGLGARHDVHLRVQARAPAARRSA